MEAGWSSESERNPRVRLFYFTLWSLFLCHDSQLSISLQLELSWHFKVQKRMQTWDDMNNELFRTWFMKHQQNDDESGSAAWNQVLIYIPHTYDTPKWPSNKSTGYPKSQEPMGIYINIYLSLSSTCSPLNPRHILDHVRALNIPISSWLFWHPVLSMKNTYPNLDRHHNREPINRDHSTLKLFNKEINREQFVLKATHTHQKKHLK